MHSRKHVARLFASLSLLGFPSLAAADEWGGARAEGRGGTGLANTTDAASAGTHVATLALDPRYDLVASGRAGPDTTWAGRVSAVDSRTSAVSLGATYTYQYDDITPSGALLPGWSVLGEDVTNQATHQGVVLGLAYPFLQRKMSVAAIGSYNWRDSEREGLDDGFNFGVALAARPHAQLTLALALQNALDLGYADTRRLVDLGARWEPGAFLGLEAQLTAEWLGEPLEDSLEEHAGVDAGVTEWLRLGAGWSHADDVHRVGGGLSLVSDKADLDYGLSAELGTQPARLWHSLDLRLHF